MGKASGPHKGGAGIVILVIIYRNLRGIPYGDHKSLCDTVCQAGICVCRGKIALHSVHHNISCAAGCLIRRKAVSQLRIHNSKSGARAVMSIRTLHHAILNCENHRRRHFRTCGGDCKNNADRQVFICFYTSIKQVFHFKIIGNAISDSFCSIDYAASANWQKEVNAFLTSNADPFFYQGKAGIGNHATKVYIGKSGFIQALMYTFQ